MLSFLEIIILNKLSHLHKGIVSQMKNHVIIVLVVVAVDMVVVVGIGIVSDD